MEIFCKGCEGLFINNIKPKNCSCCGVSISPYFLCDFCILLPLYHPLCNSCKVRGCYFDSPCHLENRRLSGKILLRIFRRKIQLVYKISQLYYRTRHRIYLPGLNEFKKLQTEFYCLAIKNDQL